MSRSSRPPRRVFAGAASLLALAAATPALAQDDPPPAHRRRTTSRTSSSPRPCARPRCSTSPSRSTRRPRQDIQRSGANTIEDLSRNVAGLTIQNLGPGQSQVSVRGVSAGQIVRDQPGVKEQVGVYLDDSVISLSLFTPDLDLFDLNRVETLRGPQGTLFGSGSVGGTIRYITNQPDLDSFEGLVEGQSQPGSTAATVGGHLKGMINVPLGRGRRDPRGRLLHPIWRLHRRARRRPAARTSMTATAPAAASRSRSSRRTDITITPRILYQEIRADGFNRQEVYNLYANPFTVAAAHLRRARAISAAARGLRRRHLARRPQRQPSISATVELTSISTYINRDIVVSRDASALTGSVSVDLGLSGRGRDCCRRTWSTRPTSRPSPRSSASRPTATARSTSSLGVFYSDTDRFYRQRLPTPGYDAFTDARFGAGTSAAVAQRLPAQLALQCRPALRHRARSRRSAR